MLESIWFFLWGLLWALYFATDGFDMGLGVLLPFLGKDDLKRRIMFNAIGPLWDGNEVWLLAASGVTFAAFPRVYAMMFSSFYTPLMLILFALILRGVSFEFRGKVDDPRWRKVWDTCMFWGSLLPAILFGVAFANIFRGLPFDDSGSNGTLVYHGTLFTLLNPYGLCGGVLFLLLFLVHGALWLAIKTEGELHESAAATARKLWLPLLIVTVVFFAASWFDTKLYQNYLDQPALFLCIAITVAALLGIRWFLAKEHYWKAWFASGLTTLGAIFFGIIGLYPNMFPSRTHPALSLTAHNAASSQKTLTLMLVVAGIAVPIVIAYQIWTYRLFRDKVTEESLEAEGGY